MYNFNHLYYFYVTAKSGNVTSAAKHLGLSQPSLSGQLKVLESALDLKLFERVGRKNQLTDSGLLVYGFCRQMFEISEAMSELLNEQTPSAARRIHIGITDEVDGPFMVEVISLFLKKHGQQQRPHVKLISGNRESLAERLRFREIDALVSELRMTDPELVNIDHGEVPVVLTCPRKWMPLGENRSHRTQEIIKKIFNEDHPQWILPSPKLKLRSDIDQIFDHQKLKGRIVFESDVPAALVRAVQDELGIAFLPLLYITRELKEKSLAILGPKKGHTKYRIWLTCHRQNEDDPLMRSLGRSFNQVFREVNL